ARVSESAAHPEHAPAGRARSGRVPGHGQGAGVHRGRRPCRAGDRDRPSRVAPPGRAADRPAAGGPEPGDPLGGDAPGRPAEGDPPGPGEVRSMDRVFRAAIVGTGRIGSTYDDEVVDRRDPSFYQGETRHVGLYVVLPINHAGAYATTPGFTL